MRAAGDQNGRIRRHAELPEHRGHVERAALVQFGCVEFQVAHHAHRGGPAADASGDVYVITGKGDFAAKVGLIDTAVKLLIYFLHERVWDRISYGRVPPTPDYEV